MSFILDALKKSENERQRASGPALFEVKVAAPKAGLPTWAVVVGVLLAINLVVLMWVLWHRGKEPAAPAASTAAVGTAPAGAADSSAAAAGEALPATATAAPGAVPAAAASRPAASRPASTLPNTASDEPMLDAGENPEDERPAVLPGSPEALAAERERARAQRALQDESERVRQQQSSTGTQRREPSVSARSSGLPTRDELVNSGRARIPELTLSLHAYDPDPARRFVFINGSRAREGDTVAGGVVLESITRDGAILSSGGQKFVLTVQ